MGNPPSKGYTPSLEKQPQPCSFVTNTHLEQRHPILNGQARHNDPSMPLLPPVTSAIFPLSLPMTLSWLILHRLSYAHGTSTPNGYKGEILSVRPDLWRTCK